jgi:hypothetical protein
MALGSTQPLTEMSTRNISWRLRLTTLPPSFAGCLESLEPQTPGTLRVFSRPVMVLLYLFTFGVETCLTFEYEPLLLRVYRFFLKKIAQKAI